MQALRSARIAMSALAPRRTFVSQSKQLKDAHGHHDHRVFDAEHYSESAAPRELGRTVRPRSCLQ